MVFDRALEFISDSSGKKIGKKIFELRSEETNLSQFFVEENDYYHDGKIIIPTSSQWELNRDH